MCDLMDCKDCRYLCKNDINDYDVEKLWKKFKDVPFIEDGNCRLVLSNNWQGWKKGTARSTIMHWFDKHYSRGIHALMWNKLNTRLEFY